MNFHRFCQILEGYYDGPQYDKLVGERNFKVELVKINGKYHDAKRNKVIEGLETLPMEGEPKDTYTLHLRVLVNTDVTFHPRKEKTSVSDKWNLTEDGTYLVNDRTGKEIQVPEQLSLEKIVSLFQDNKNTAYTLEPYLDQNHEVQIDIS